MKKKTNISDKTLSLINKKQIKPIPKWEFVLKNWGIIIGLAICFGLLTMGVGISWFGLIDNIITPYFWILITGIFLTVSYLFFQRTKKAYRFEKWMVIAVMIIGGFVAGGIMFKTGVANKIDRDLESRIAMYRKVVPMKMTVWNNPETGYLSGEIINVIDTNDFKIKDFYGNIWTITGNNPLIRGRVQMADGEVIKLIGTKIDNNSFKADEIRPWGGMGQNNLKEKR